MNNILTLQSGLPFTPTMQTSNLNTGTGSQFPNRTGSGQLSDSDRSINRWFDSGVFASPAQYAFGNSGRNILYGPGTHQLDLSLFKSFPIGEKGPRVEFRAEAFNIFNHLEYSWLGGDGGSASSNANGAARSSDQIACYGGANNSAGDSSCTGVGASSPLFRASSAHNARILQLALKFIF